VGDHVSKLSNLDPVKFRGFAEVVVFDDLGLGLGRIT
jgi:hypothetical protein